MTNVKRLLAWGGGAVAVGLFGLPALHFAVFGTLPRGCTSRHAGLGRGTAPGESRPRGRRTHQEAREAFAIKPPRVDAGSLDRVRAFTPFYYARDMKPDLARLKQWGANAIVVIVEDQEGYAEQNNMLRESGVSGMLELMERSPEHLDLEQEAAALVSKAHGLGMAVVLAIPVSDRWLELAERWRVGMIWINGEADAGVPDRMDAEAVNRASAALLRRARSGYSGLIGTGFTNLMDRMPATAFQPAAHAAILDVSGFDFLTVNPHPDPGMDPDRLLSYAEASVREARRIAGRCGVRKVLLGAVMVRSGSGELQGFINPELRAYPPLEEKDFYDRLFDRTWDLLDGTFLDLSGWEKRPAVEVIRERYKA